MSQTYDKNQIQRRFYNGSVIIKTIIDDESITNVETFSCEADNFEKVLEIIKKEHDEEEIVGITIIQTYGNKIVTYTGDEYTSRFT